MSHSPQNPLDALIVGGGIIGLATAMELLRRFPGRRLAVLEKEDRVAVHQSGNNSGVIHSGLYYKPGSLKAKLCVEGAAAMVAFCREHNIVHEICGKVVVATSERELPALQELFQRGRANGVPGLSMIGPERLRALEPHAAGIQALHVASTGITDYAAITRKYADLVQGAGSVIATGTKLLALSRRDGQVIAETNRGEYRARQMINCAGLYSDYLSRMAGAETDVRIVPFRGEYYELAPHKRGLVRGLIYPVPDPALPFLGVHFTRRVNGSVEAGPNAVLALRREGYGRTDLRLGELLETLAWPGFRRMAWRQWRSAVGEYYRSFRKSAFVQALQMLVPEIRETDLTPGGAGVRAQAVDREGNLVDDFRLACSPGMVHVLNVPSPAATASLVIAREIVNLAERNGC